MQTVANVGDILAGKYRVDRVLGIGGMGMVVAATHLDLDQKVALKFMLADAASAPDMLDRFMREARAVVKLRSEHVCRVLDVGRLESGAPYIVMELMEGVDLARLLTEQGRLPTPIVVDYVMQATAGVAEAHAHEIVHRDLKPSNLFVTTTNDGLPLVKVLDFGISKSPIGGATRTAEVMGSPGFMAPEQMVSSKAVDARADLWSLGVILYVALAQRMPWDQESLPALCMSVMSDPPPPLPETIPAGLRAVVQRCLEKDRDARYADVGQLATALAPFASPASAQLTPRIVNVLRHTSSNVAGAGVSSQVASVAGPALAKPHALGGAIAPTELPPAGKPPGLNALAPLSFAPPSTFTAGAAELNVPREPRRRRRWLLAGVSAVVLAGAIVVITALQGDDTTAQSTTTAPTHSPAPSDVSPGSSAPAATPSAAAASATPNATPAASAMPAPPSPPASVTTASPAPASASAASPAPAPTSVPTAPTSPPARRPHSSPTTTTHAAATRPAAAPTAPATPPTATTSSPPPTPPPAAATPPDWTHMTHDRQR
jgi:serine/threonine-protein kinase